MSLGDLIFLMAVLLTAGTCLRAGYLLLRRRTAHSRRLVRRWPACALVYLVVLVGVSFVQPQRSIPPGAAQCFDEWCLVVDRAVRRHALGTTSAAGDFLIVSLHVVNESRGRPQREADVYAELRDDHDQRYLASSRGQEALQQQSGTHSTLRDSVAAGHAATMYLVFDVPPTAQQFAIVVRHDWFPHALIIGDPESLLHKPVVVPLAVAAR